MKIMLHNTQPLLGDRLMFTPAVRDLKASKPDYQIGVVSAGPEIWLNNPHLDCSVTEQNADHIFNIGPGKVTRGSKTNGLHIAQAFAQSLQEQLFEAALIDRPLYQGPIRPDLHLSPAERDYRLIDGYYWVVNIDTGPFSAKRWPPERFQQVVDALPNLTFVQIGLAKDNRYRLEGPNVIDLIDRTKIRDLFGLVYHAEGCISLVSSLAHVAGAFQRPCVTIAGGREPDTFERYPNHRYIDNVGALPCCRHAACWHNALSACEDHDEQHARCMRLIQPHEVSDAVLSYYEGGALDRIPPSIEPARRRPLIRIIASARYLGGAERSVVEIAKIFSDRQWLVEFASPTEQPSPEVIAALPDTVRITQHVTWPCDVLLLYASDQVFNFDQDRYKVFERIQAGRKVMALTYKIGKAGEVPWTKGWDWYLFLSTALRDGFVKKLPPSPFPLHTSVLAPPVDLDPFLKVQPNYQGQPRVVTRYTTRGQPIIVRHSSQGDKKFPPDLAEIINATPNPFYKFMPGPAGLALDDHQGACYPYSPHVRSVADFLASGNMFWYLLPAGYTDQGPRVVCEAMAAGLAVLAENRDGPADRVTPETGWLIDDRAEAVDIINNVTPEVLEQKGRAARERAINEFDKTKWFTAISGV